MPSLNSSTASTTPDRRGPPSVLTVTRSFTFIVFLLSLCASVEQFSASDSALPACLLVFSTVYT
ncbi:hypothetical protein R518_22665 [Salmonella enterica subsp. enterica serovar Cerro]|nr:hypothetical protein R518_22665 [Salmonella enterica subsp. enterica serovar Cerro]